MLYACAGCAADAQLARDVGAALDRRGLAESSWLGGAIDAVALAAKARSRWPVFAIDGCPQICAQRWLAGQGVRPQRCFLLAGGADAEAAADRVAGGL